MVNYQKAEIVRIRELQLDEKWLQRLIADDPAILGLGAVIVRGWEIIQPGKGRLDLLLQSADVESQDRYEIEIQLGKTDESHIIRTIEYWDNERKRSPQYNHHAVIVAEEITGRFLNVIGLFGGSIPLIALQVSAIKMGEYLTVTFTRVVDEVKRSLDDDVSDPAEQSNRAYWEDRSKATLEVADEVLGILKSFDPSIELNYNKRHIGLFRQERVDNFVVFSDRQTATRMSVRIPQSAELDKDFEDAELAPSFKNNKYVIRMKQDSLVKNSDLIRKVLEMAYKNAVE